MTRIKTIPLRVIPRLAVLRETIREALVDVVEEPESLGERMDGPDAMPPGAMSRTRSACSWRMLEAASIGVGRSRPDSGANRSWMAFRPHARRWRRLTFTRDSPRGELSRVV